MGGQSRVLRVVLKDIPDEALRGVLKDFLDGALEGVLLSVSLRVLSAMSLPTSSSSNFSLWYGGVSVWGVGILGAILTWVCLGLSVPGLTR